jgi:hypothetical protein
MDVSDTRPSARASSTRQGRASTACTSSLEYDGLVRLRVGAIVRSHLVVACSVAHTSPIEWRFSEVILYFVSQLLVGCALYSWSAVCSTYVYEGPGTQKFGVLPLVEHTQVGSLPHSRKQLIRNTST